MHCILYKVREKERLQNKKKRKVCRKWEKGRERERELFKEFQESMIGKYAKKTPVW